MKFTRLRLIGFKSFVEPTDVPIEDGLTGIVGPNGCGKSNLVEALRWVMGEASHKAMRAEDMDDVIFSGSGGRPARNTAEVMLSLDNGARTAPGPFNAHDTIEVSRRIERDAGSAYRINGREARARDVQILFADASSGSRSPALVRQGQIGEIVNAKPQARRRLLEEAAGIAGLHARRHEAEIRLKAAETNLARLEDVIGQIAGQIDGLKRQARQAVRYRALSAEIRRAEAGLLHLRWQDATAALAAADGALAQAERHVAEATRAQAEAAREQAVAAHVMPALRDGEAKAAAALALLSNTRDGLEREEARAAERRAELDRRLAQLEQDRARETQLAADAREALARLSAEEAAIAAERAGQDERAASAGPRLAAAETALAASEARFSDATAAAADLSARRNQMQRAIKEHSDRLARLEQQIAAVEADLARLGQSGDDARLAAAQSAVAAAHAAAEAADAHAQQREAAHRAARETLEAARRPHADAEKRSQRLDAEVRTLNKVLALDRPETWPPAVDQITVARGYETALGTALGDDLDAPTDTSAPLHWAGADIADGDPPLPEGAEPLARYVEAPQALARRLAQIGVVARADGARLKPLLKAGQRLVSREGDLWRWDGLTAAAHAPTAAARRLAEKNRLGDLVRDLDIARTEVAALAIAVESADAALRSAQREEAAAHEAARAARRALDAARDALARAERDTSERAQRLSALAEAKVRLASSRDEAVVVLHETDAALAGLAPAATLDAELDAARLVVARDRAALAEARAEVQTIEREREGARRRLAAIEAERRQWTERSAGADERIAAVIARQDEAAGERAVLDELPAQFAERRRALLGEIATADGARREAADRLAEGETALADADRRARAALTDMSAAREELARITERRRAAEERLSDIVREIADALGDGPDAAARQAGFKAGAVPAIAELEVDLDRARRDREKLGAVNLRADEELAEVQAQHDGLVRERDDLIEAIRRLRQGIGNLNREARERLAASFASVDTHFRTLFEKLFGGGVAELQLTESDDPLEAGLDILAKPPGKKPQTLSLLSGGEQALTAMALIFAVFLTNPAPICVLDEVDAPLDDANVERFCDLLDEMTKLTDTRFLVITHNPITMARMNRLYGVTMAERGVSQLVAVDLQEAQRFREVA